jgi:hypothetical protein
MLASHLTYLIEAQQPADLRQLAEHLPYEWIDRAVQATGTASIRRRRLPADMTSRVKRDRFSVFQDAKFPEGDVAVSLDGGSP